MISPFIINFILILDPLHTYKRCLVYFICGGQLYDCVLSPLKKLILNYRLLYCYCKSTIITIALESLGLDIGVGGEFVFIDFLHVS
jgi:hypothetical protein